MAEYEQVEVVHSETGRRRTFPRRAFERLWSRRGWQEYDPAASAVTGAVVEAVGSESANLKRFTKPQLVGIGAELGLVLDEGELKDDLIAAIEERAAGTDREPSEEE